MALIRQAITDLNDLSRLANVEIIDDIVSYHNRQGDKETVRAAIKRRYGIGIKKVADGTEGTVETYTRDGFAEQVDAGLIEAISSGFAPKIVNALATLFTERGQKYTLTHEATDDVESAESLLNDHRDYGGYNATMTAADKLSIQTGSAAVYLSFVRDHVRYQHFSPADITVFFGDFITEDDEIRIVDQTDLEDATAVRIRLSQVDASTWNYLLILGSSDIWPNGRHVTYQADESGGDLPAVGADNTIDWMPEGSDEPANPLSYWANTNPTESDLPEYPIAIIKSGITASGDVMPTSTSLYDDSVEMDIAASHLLSTSQEAAAGTTVITREHTGRNHPLPTTLTGKLALDSGQAIEHLDLGSSASVDGMQVLKDLQIEIAAGYSVPDFMVASEDHMLEASSGISLQIKARPLKKAREERIELNVPTIGKIFQIETILMSLFLEGSDSELKQLAACSLDWDAGELKLPENKKEASERIIALMDKGILDTIEAIREYYQLTSDEDAIAFYEKMSDRKTDYPPLAEPEQPVKPGLNLRSAKG